jgi:hypothetical protein
MLFGRRTIFIVIEPIMFFTYVVFENNNTKKLIFLFLSISITFLYYDTHLKRMSHNNLCSGMMTVIKQPQQHVFQDIMSEEDAHTGTTRLYLTGDEEFIPQYQFIPYQNELVQLQTQTSTNVLMSHS